MNNMLKIFDSGHALSTVVGAQELLKPKLLELKNAKAEQIAKIATKQKEKASKKKEAERKRAQKEKLLDEGSDDAGDSDDVPSKNLKRKPGTFPI